MPALLAASIALLAILFSVHTSSAQTSLTKNEGETIVIEDAPEMNVISFGKTVIIKQSAKEVFVWGGDVIVEGRVEGDVATLGGSIIQKEGGFIGGAVIVIGGSYKPESAVPLRTEGKETVMFGMFEEEFREMAQNPSQIFAPTLTPAFLAQRILSALFWFIITFVFASLAPGAVSRAITRLHLSPAKVAGIGVGSLIFATMLIIAALQILPDYAGAVVGLMSFVLLMLAYGFGRVVLQVSVGKAIQRKMPEGIGRSEAVSIFLGVIVWTLVLSVPYVWTIAVIALFSAGIGLVLTARSGYGWKTS